MVNAAAWKTSLIGFGICTPIASCSGRGLMQLDVRCPSIFPWAWGSTDRTLIRGQVFLKPRARSVVTRQKWFNGRLCDIIMLTAVSRLRSKNLLRGARCERPCEPSASL
jgi:hypothetical protein